MPAALALVLALASGQIVDSSRYWSAIDRGSRCEALSRPVSYRGEAVAGLAFDRGRRGASLAIRTSRAPRAGSTVMAVIGSESFLLASRGDWAFSTDSRQAMAMIEAIRANERLRIRFTARSGQRLSDYYLLAGAPTAIDAAAARCSVPFQN